MANECFPCALKLGELWHQAQYFVPENKSARGAAVSARELSNRLSEAVKTCGFPDISSTAPDAKPLTEIAEDLANSYEAAYDTARAETKPGESPLIVAERPARLDLPTHKLIDQIMENFVSPPGGMEKGFPPMATVLNCLAETERRSCLCE